MASEDDIQRWGDELAGRSVPDGSDPEGTAALRRAVRAEDGLVRDAGAADRVGLERLMRRLESEGLLGAPARAPAARPGSLRPWLAAAATLAAVAIGLRLLPPTGVEPQPPTPIEKPRGFAGVLKQSVPDPAAAAARALAELTALGLPAREVPGEGRRIVEVDVGADQLDAYRGWAEPRGGRVAGPGRYRIILEAAP